MRCTFVLFVCLPLSQFFQIDTYCVYTNSLKEDLNGVDFDWEQPSTQQEYIAYIHLIAEAAVELHSYGLLVSVAPHPEKILPKKVYIFMSIEYTSWHMI